MVEPLREGENHMYYCHVNFGRAALMWACVCCCRGGSGSSLIPWVGCILIVEGGD